MKKNRIMKFGGIAGALALLISACSPGSLLSGPKITSEWEAGEGNYVVCQNFDNKVSFSFNLLDSDTLINVKQIFKGENIDSYDTEVTLTRNQAHISGRQVTVSHTFGDFAVPYSLDSADLDSQAIVVVPKPEDDPAAEQGVLKARYVVKTHGGTHYLPGRDSYYELAVWGGCEEV